MRFSNAAAAVAVLAGAAGVTAFFFTNAPAAARATVQPAPAPVRIATVDILAIVERLVLSDEFRVPRDKFFTDTDAPVAALEAELRALADGGRTLAPDAPELPALRDQFNQMNARFEQSRQAAAEAKERFSTTQVSQAYTRAVAEARALAASMGYSHLLVSRQGEPAIRSDNVSGAVQEILARPVITADPADDLTTRLVTALRLDAVVPAQPVAPAPGLAP